MIKHAWLTLLRLGTEGMSIDKRVLTTSSAAMRGPWARPAWTGSLLITTQSCKDRFRVPLPQHSNPRQHLRLLFAAHHPALVFEARELVEVEVAVDLGLLGVDLGGGDRQVLVLGGDETNYDDDQKTLPDTGESAATTATIQAACSLGANAGPARWGPHGPTLTAQLPVATLNCEDRFRPPKGRDQSQQAWRFPGACC